MIYIKGPNFSLIPTRGKEDLVRTNGKSSGGAEPCRIIVVFMAHVPDTLVQRRWHAPLLHAKTG